MHKKYKNLIIIGNGFDRWQGLPTSYGNFIDYYNLHIEQILRKLHVKKLKIKNPEGKNQKINPVDLIYSNPINPKPLEDEFFWNFEQSVALLDDHLINLCFGKSNRGLRKLRRTVQQAQTILRIVFSNWIHSIVVPNCWACNTP